MDSQEPIQVPSFSKKSASSSFLIMTFKSFAVLGLLGAIFFGIYWGFGRVAFESLNKRELYSQILRGQLEVRRMAALEWATQLQNADTESNIQKSRDFLPTDEESLVLSQELKSLEASARPDTELAAGILGVLGHSYSSVAASALKDFLAKPRGPEWAKAQVQSVVGLSRRFAADADLVRLYENLLKQNPDTSVRKAIAYALGFVGEGEPTEEQWSQRRDLLQELLNDSENDVKLNASFSSLRLSMDLELGQSYVSDLIAGLAQDVQSPPDKAREKEIFLMREAYLQALMLADKINSRFASHGKVWSAIEEVADGHPDLKIRQAAKVALKKKR